MSNKIFLSKSGIFVCDKDGYAYHFKPKEENQLKSDNNYRLILRHLIIPEGVIGFKSEFGRNIMVTEQFVLPKGLLVIGQFYKDADDNLGCVFADSKLPLVIIPATVQSSGCFAFGNSRIDVLCVPREYTIQPKEYVRAYKDCRVHKLYIHQTGLISLSSGGIPKEGNIRYTDSNFLNGLHADEVYAYSECEEGCLPEYAMRII